MTLLNTTLAQAVGNESTSTTLEFDWPESARDWVLFAGFALAIIYVVWMYVRDTRALSPLWTVWLTALRLAVIAALVVIALNPQQRTQKDAYRPSQVALLVDTSTSMQQSATDPRSSGEEAPESRAAAVHKLLAGSPLVQELQKLHHVDLYTFDSDLSESLHRFETDYDPRHTAADEQASANGASETAEVQPPVDWDALLQPRGNSTRLGDAVDKLLAELKGKTLSGIVIVSDGASNVGRDVGPANERAKNAGVRLVVVGVGGTEPPLNIQIARVIAPTDVQLPQAADARDGQDMFELTAFIQSQGLGGRTVQVELLRKFADDEESVVIGSKEVTLPEGADPATVTFEEVADRKGAVDYTLRVVTPAGVRESRDDDNEQTRTINVFDEPLKVLLVAGGPMKDYVFAKNALYRHRSMQVDVWLQTGEPGISQDANEILFEFPKTREDLFQYDVIVAFDPDWEQIPGESQEMLEDWVSDEGGGLILVAGDVYTPLLAAALDNAENADSLQPIAALYPVLLEELRYGIGATDRADESFPIGLTQDGEAAGFLQLEDEPAAEDVWEQFRVFRCYPTRGRKGGTTVYAEFTDPLARGQDGQPVLLAGQRYSQGHTIYLGSPEIWRLRSVDEEYYDRFWIKLVRKAGEGRTRRGIQGNMLILEGRDYDVGQTVPVRARVLNSQFEALDQDRVSIEVYDPTGKPLVPALVLTRDPNRPAEYTGDFLAALPGRYKLELPVPDSRDVVTADVNVTLPALEMSELRQNVTVLTKLTEGTGGGYVSIDDALARVPALLPNMGQQIIIDQQLRELWDRQWVLFLLVALLGAEWLTRKLLKLA
jgi:hypothetical protein